MRVLIIEDDRNKLENLKLHLESKPSSAKVTTAMSFNAGLKAITSDSFDLVILDMTLPSFDGLNGMDEGKPRPLGGMEILTQMKLRGLKIKTIVVTQFESFGTENISLEKLSEKLAKMFSFYIGSVYYNASQASWSRDLDLLLAEATRL